MDNPERKKPRKDDGDGGGSAGDSSVPLSKKARRKIAKTQRKLAAKRQQAGCIRRQVLGELRPLLTEAQVTELQKAPQTSEEDPTESATKVVPTSRAGKAGRARAVLNGDENVPTGRHAHRARGGRFVGDVPIDLRPIVDVLEKYEAQLRVERHPTLVARAMVPMDCHGTIDMAASVSSTVQQAEALAQPKLIDTAMCGTPNGSASQVLSLRSRGLRELKLSSLPLQHFATSTVPVTGLVSLDLSRNELWDLPRLHSLACLRSLNLSRNWFASLPQSLSDLPNLEELRVCHNMLRPSDNSLRLSSLMSWCPSLKLLDLRFNQKLGRKSLADRVQAAVGPSVLVRTTVCWDGKAAPEGAFEGESSAHRDARLLRSQLEPWGTTVLRRRLVSDFGQPPSSVDPEHVSRAEVMQKLLQCYAQEKLCHRCCVASQGNESGATSGNESTGSAFAQQHSLPGPVDKQQDFNSCLDARPRVHVRGAPVDETICQQLLNELKGWAASGKSSGAGRERPSISAHSYMILSSPMHILTLGARKAVKAIGKLKAHSSIWQLAKAAIETVDPEFAAAFTALAVTHNFQGSPHIDKQNVGPFYAMALGDFPPGQGGIHVECSARVVAEVDTHNRLGKVDGRNPHWVAPYDSNCERFSVVFYKTQGPHAYPGPAIFSVPDISERRPT
eukprot:INCI13170.1.p1 GENE.INCI13170.1~~INCI13170.1.p1  ORF type:complete len:685 (+),score=101.37 INCI13170.1:37-2055(+)